MQQERSSRRLHASSRCVAETSLLLLLHARRIGNGRVSLSEQRTTGEWDASQGTVVGEEQRGH